MLHAKYFFKKEIIRSSDAQALKHEPDGAIKIVKI